MLMPNGTDIARVVEAAGAGLEDVLGPAVEEELSDVSEWEDWSMGDWVAGTGVDMGVAGAVAGAGGESKGEELLAGAEVVRGWCQWFTRRGRC